MSKGKNLLAEAIAEAKVVREAAIRNATKQLEENLTPSIKEMLANKLEEEMDLNEGEDEENIEENANSGFKEVKPKNSQKVNEDDDPDAGDDDDDAAEDADAAADDADAAADDADAAAEDADAAADDADATDEPAGSEDDAAADDDTPLKDITLGDLKQIISDLVAASAAPAPGGDMGADMDPGDVEGMGDETPAGDPAASAQAEPANELPAGDATTEDPAAGDDDDEIDISEILRELEEEEKNAGKTCPKCGKEQCICKENKVNDEMPENQNGKEHHKEPNENGPSQDSELNELRKENKELKEGLQKCLKTLKDVNLLNSKLTVTSKLLSRPNLSESQKANIIKTIDGAKTSKEAVALGKTLIEGLRNTRKAINEHRGSASKSAGSSTASRKANNDLIDEGMVRRFQQLAGIIKD